MSKLPEAINDVDDDDDDDDDDDIAKVSSISEYVPQVCPQVLNKRPSDLLTFTLLIAMPLWLRRTSNPFHSVFMLS